MLPTAAWIAEGGIRRKSCDLLLWVRERNPRTARPPNHPGKGPRPLTHVIFFFDGRQNLKKKSAAKLFPPRFFVSLKLKMNKMTQNFRERIVMIQIFQYPRFVNKVNNAVRRNQRENCQNDTNENHRFQRADEKT